MPILSNFPGGGGTGSGLALGAVSAIQTMTAPGRAYIKWTDPEDLVVAGSTLAEWSGTLLVRKAGSAPVSRRDGVIVLDSKERNAYQNTYFLDSGLTNGITYYYKLFPYTTRNAYTDDDAGLFEISPVAIAPGKVTGITTELAGNGKIKLTWTDPDDIVQGDIKMVEWASTKVVYKAGSCPADPTDGTLALNSTTKDQYKTSPLLVSGLENGTTYYFALFPVASDGTVNTK